MNIQFGFQTAFGCLHFQQFHECAVDIVFRQHRQHFNLLDQLQVVGLHRIEAVYLVVGLFVGGGIAQGKQRVQRFDGGAAIVGFHILRLVDNHNRAGLADLADGRFAAFVDAVNYIGVFFKRLDIHHQNFNVVIGGEIA